MDLKILLYEGLCCRTHLTIHQHHQLQCHPRDILKFSRNNWKDSTQLQQQKSAEIKKSSISSVPLHPQQPPQSYSNQNKVPLQTFNSSCYPRNSFKCYNYTQKLIRDNNEDKTTWTRPFNTLNRPPVQTLKPNRSFLRIHYFFETEKYKKTR